MARQAFQAVFQWLSFPIPSRRRGSASSERLNWSMDASPCWLLACEILRKIETEIALPKKWQRHRFFLSPNDLRTLVHSKNVCPVKLVRLHDVLTPQKSRDRMQASVGLVTQHYVRLPGFDMAGTGSRFFWWSRCCVEATGRGTHGEDALLKTKYCQERWKARSVPKESNISVTSGTLPTDNLVASGLTGPASSIPLSQSQPSTNSAPWHWIAGGGATESWQWCRIHITQFRCFIFVVFLWTWINVW